jgi:hypothetical protein
MCLYLYKMATARPFAYNPTLQTDGVFQQFGDLAVGFPNINYSDSPGGLKWWNGPDEELGYCIGTSLPVGGILAPDGIYGDVTFWRTQTFSDEEFLVISNTITNENFTSTSEAVTWLNSNGYWTSYAGVPTATPTNTPTSTPSLVTPTPTNTPTSTLSLVTPTPTPTNSGTPASTPTPTPTNSETPASTPTPTPTPLQTIFTHGEVRANCSDYCTTNYNITTLTTSSANYSSLGDGSIIYGISGSGFIAYSDEPTNTAAAGTFKIAEIDSSGVVLSVSVCVGGVCVVQ